MARGGARVRGDGGVNTSEVIIGHLAAAEQLVGQRLVHAVAAHQPAAQALGAAFGLHAFDLPVFHLAGHGAGGGQVQVVAHAFEPVLRHQCDQCLLAAVQAGSPAGGLRLSEAGQLALEPAALLPGRPAWAGRLPAKALIHS